MNRFSKRFCIEIEMVFSPEGKPECSMIYFGDCSTVREFLQDLLLT